MADIPVHRLKTEKKLIAFEVMQWRKNISKTASTLPHRHDYYEVLVFEKGGGVHEIDFISYANKSCSLHFVSANQVHQVRRAPGSGGFSLLFAREFFPPDFALQELEFYKTGAYPVLDLSRTRFEEVAPLINEIRNEYAGGEVGSRELLQSLLRAFLLKAQRLYKNVNHLQEKHRATLNAFTKKFESLVEEHFRQHWRAGDYAKTLNVSPARLNALSRQHYSLSTEAFIQKRVLLETKRLLVYSPKSVKEICYEMNFDDPAYFNRFFRKNAGCTPLEYRESVRD